ncbi:MAG: hypothetical protein J1F11_03430 [Oscillospiraceae bacterium]|nr:hypothetical protein [Oscillospiraceae bacterium]
MKKFMLIIISVIMLFSACNSKSVQTQIDPAEEFDGITFGMTKDEIINFLGKEPDIIFETDDDDRDYNDIWYMHEEHFNISDVDVIYSLKRDANVLCRVDYSFPNDEYTPNQFMNDYNAVKEEILRRYPGEVQIDSQYSDRTILNISTENRRVVFSANDNLYMHISIEEYRPGSDSTRSDSDIEE